MMSNIEYPTPNFQCPMCIPVFTIKRCWMSHEEVVNKRLRLKHPVNWEVQSATTKVSSQLLSDLINCNKK